MINDQRHVEPIFLKTQWAPSPSAPHLWSIVCIHCFLRGAPSQAKIVSYWHLLPNSAIKASPTSLSDQTVRSAPIQLVFVKKVARAINYKLAPPPGGEGEAHNKTSVGFAFSPPGGDSSLSLETSNGEGYDMQ